MTSDHVNAKVVADGEEDLVPLHLLVVFNLLPGLYESLGHHHIDRDLEIPEMVLVVSADLLRQADHFLKVEMDFSFSGSHTEGRISCQTIVTDFALLHLGL